MRETVHIENPKGVLRLKGDKYDSILYLKEIPIQFTWIREIGSTWRYQIAKSVNESDLIQDNSFRHFVKFGNLTVDSLAQQFDYILKMLSSGKYDLSIDYLSHDLDLVESVSESRGYYSFDTYGGLEDIIETQSYYNKDLIDDYIKLIQKGTEPVIIVLTSLNSKNRFILDGHHKFIAYSRLKKNPRALIITQLDSDKIDNDEAMNIFDISNCKNQDYKKRYLDK